MSLLVSVEINVYRLCPWLWWKFDSSVSEPGIFLSQLPYNERSQISQGLSIPLHAAFNGETCLRSRHPSMRRIWI